MTFDAKKAFDHDKTYAERAIIARGQLAPIFVVHAANGDVVPVLIGNFSPETRELTYLLARTACIAFDAVALGMITEAWMATQPIGTPIEHAPSEREDRIEVVIVSMAVRDDATGEIAKYFSGREILRDATGKVTGLAELTMDGQPEGRLFDVLPDQRVPPVAQQAALALLSKAGLVFKPEPMQ